MATVRVFLLENVEPPEPPRLATSYYKTVKAKRRAAIQQANLAKHVSSKVMVAISLTAAKSMTVRLVSHAWHQSAALSVILMILSMKSVRRVLMHSVPLLKAQQAGTATSSSPNRSKMFQQLSFSQAVTRRPSRTMLKMRPKH